jgi:hypothetical protein
VPAQKQLKRQLTLQEHHLQQQEKNETKNIAQQP